ncbi:MAG TPA: tetratricopeptide repeat protein [Anaerolineae bacterium]|nr:tetratricopeptide repeat protein [Anaerolineae bacterium]
MEDNKQEQFNNLLKRGTDLLRAGKTAAALPLLEKAYKIDPENADAALNLSGAYILSKRFREAVPILEKLSERDPDNAMVWTNLGAAYLGNPVLANDAEQMKAVAAFKQALAVNPAAPHVAYNIGLIYRDRQDNEAAIHWFRKALQANPRDKDARRLITRLEKENDSPS